jgi:hypothetical protein
MDKVLSRFGGSSDPIILPIKPKTGVEEMQEAEDERVLKELREELPGHK